MQAEQKNNRRDFLKGAVTGLGFGTLATMGMFSYSPMRSIFLPQTPREMSDFGAVKSVKVTNISETSWFDNATLMGDMKGAGGLLVNQYLYNWPPFGDGTGLAKGSYERGIAKIKHLLPNRLEEAWDIVKENSVNPQNAGGFAALVEIEHLDGQKKKYLLDSGWSYEWMDEAFKREGIDKMLQNGEIEALIISHEHFDHFWGLPVTLKYAPNIKMIIPDGFYKEGLQYIKDSGHTGELIVHKKGRNDIEPGFCAYTFDVPIICRVFGELSLFANVEGKGLVSITGCCHQGIIQFISTAKDELKYDNDKMYGIYGGLHISPFDDWDPKYDDLVISMEKWDFSVIACNHCTGVLTAEKFLRAGYPVVEGTARHRSKSHAYLGNGDQITFG
ncbi:MAG: MBL fold metallo-hydrolase [Sulfurospirillaceae bacterium]|jgi:7,8-dihydropterin-6-yl-methyl-4-(beta-D-ribofuranosyl)aminobenzene 5'-phosphate synthase|nr:MBL fold metallo-hydrolase [Sulfurospirillaceae bacterium]MCK9546722.1 MBL fold metallo-hydrolase [Sulfurospirillaceae bacterium]MDY0238521.1 MBL fold metallo-hydrolase [Campylobacterales bacterium]NLM98916.1 MBL fold metallo-hydrolase [Campylobacteraceae bacterium]